MHVDASGSAVVDPAAAGVAAADAVWHSDMLADGRWAGTAPADTTLWQDDSIILLEQVLAQPLRQQLLFQPLGRPWGSKERDLSRAGRRNLLPAYLPSAPISASTKVTSVLGGWIALTKLATTAVSNVEISGPIVHIMVLLLRGRITSPTLASGPSFSRLA